MTRSVWSVVAALVATGLPAAATASGAVGQQLPAPNGTERLELIDQDFAIDAGGTIELRYRLTGVADDALGFTPTPAPEPPPPEPPDATTADTIPDGTGPVGPDGAPIEPEPPVQLTIEVTNYAPLTDASELARVVGSAVDPDAFSDVIDGVALFEVRDLATVDTDGSIIIDLMIGTDVVDSVEDQLKFAGPGIYPIRVQLLVGDPDDDQVVATAGTIVQRLPAASDPVAGGVEPPPIDLSVMTVTPETPVEATPAELATAVRAFDEAVALADELQAPVTLEVPPPIVADTTLDAEDAERIADALSGDELVALPILPLDVSSAVAAGQEETFARLLIAGADVLTESIPTTPSRRDVWISTDALSAGGAQELRDLGVRFVVVPEDVYRTSIDPVLPATDRFVNASLPDGGALPLLVVSPLSDQLSSTAADEILEEATSTEWAVETLAGLLLDRRDDPPTVETRPQRSLVLSTPDLSAPDVRLLTGLERLVATTPSARFTRGSELIGVTDVQQDDGQPVTVELPETAGVSLNERVPLIEATALTMISAASMLPDDDPRPVSWSDELSVLVSTGFSDAEVEEATSALVAEADALKQAVVAPDPFTFTLTGRSGPIEIRLRNTSDEPLDVLVELESTKVEFPDGPRVVTLRPNDETSVIVPVEARSNGTSSIDLLISTPGGEALGEPVTLTSRVTGFTGLGQLLMGGLFLVLLTWWFTHWRARRRNALADEGRQRHPTGREVTSDAL